VAGQQVFEMVGPEAEFVADVRKQLTKVLF
jgi:hypothetical protein